MHYLDPNNYWRDDLDDRPVIVSVYCTAYNHGRYIRQALDGFVMQQTDFRYEVIVHDDASTDDTASILREYAQRYPSIIKPIFQTENQYSKRDFSVTRTMNSHLRGKYVAMCEGDDYWTDPHKLQRQVDFLESHPDYTMCFHSHLEKYQDAPDKDRILQIQDREYTPQELTSEYISQTATLLYRTDILQSDKYRHVTSRHFQSGDVALILSCASYGRIYGMSQAMSVYRLHGGGISNITKSDSVGMTNEYLWFVQVFDDPIRSELKKKMVIPYATAVHHSLSSGRYAQALRLSLRVFACTPINTVKLYWRLLTLALRGQL